MTAGASPVQIESANRGAAPNQGCSSSFATALMVTWIALLVIGGLAVSDLQSPALAWGGLCLGVVFIVLAAYHYYRERQLTLFALGVALQAIGLGLTLATGIKRLPPLEMGKGLLITTVLSILGYGGGALYLETSKVEKGPKKPQETSQNTCRAEDWRAFADCMRAMPV